MQRREFLFTSLGAAVAARMPFQTAARKLKFDIQSRHLQWLRSPNEIADAVAEMSFDGIDLNIGPYPAHVNLDKVAQDLPALVTALRKREMQVVSITTSITEADATAENVLKAASAAGITHYTCGQFSYDKTKAVMPQLDALRPRITKLAALNAKYKLTGLLPTNSTGNDVGSALWDWLVVLKDVDPSQLGIQYDVFHQAQNDEWEFNLRSAGKYVAALTVRDYAYEQDLGLKGEGGPFTPPPPGSQPEGRGGGGRGGRGGAPGGGPPGGGRGGNRGAANNAPIVPGLVNGWKLKEVPLGTGMINLPQLGVVLKEIGFSGPVEISVQYPNGGANDAQDKITLPATQVLGTMKRDLLALRGAFTRSGLI